MNAIPAVDGVASVLGIKCVNLFSCACVSCLGKRGAEGRGVCSKITENGELLFQTC